MPRLSMYSRCLLSDLIGMATSLSFQCHSAASWSLLVCLLHSHNIKIDPRKARISFESLTQRIIDEKYVSPDAHNQLILFFTQVNLGLTLTKYFTKAQVSEETGTPFFDRCSRRFSSEKGVKAKKATSWGVF